LMATSGATQAASLLLSILEGSGVAKVEALRGMGVWTGVRFHPAELTLPS